MQTVRKGSKDSLHFVLIDQDSFEPITINAAGSECHVLSAGGNELSGPHVITVDGTSKAIYTPASDWDLEIQQGYAIKWTLVDGAAKSYTRYTYFGCVWRMFDSQVQDSDINKEDPIAQTRFPAGVTSFAGWRRSAWRDIGLHVSRAVGQDPGTLFYPNEFAGVHVAWTLRDFYTSNGSTDAGDEERAKMYDRKGQALINLALQRVARDEDETNTLNLDREVSNKITNWRI